MGYTNQYTRRTFDTGNPDRFRSLLVTAVCSAALMTAAPGFAQNGSGGSSAGGGTAPQLKQANKSTSSQNDGTALTRKTIKASDVIGSKVNNPSGKTLGEISDIMLNWKTHKINYLVLSHGGVAGIGSKYFAVPPSAFKASSKGSGLILHVSTNKLNNMKGFDTDNPPQTADASQWGVSSGKSRESNMAGHQQAAGARQKSGGGRSGPGQEKMKRSSGSEEPADQDKTKQSTGKDHMKQSSGQRGAAGQEKMNQSNGQ